MPPSPNPFLQGGLKRLPIPFITSQPLTIRTAGKQSLSLAKPPYARPFHLSADYHRPRLNTSNILNNVLKSRMKFRAPRRPNSTNSKSSSSSSSSSNLSFSQRMKKLSREYGWSALGVYLTLSALDFPFCFAAVRLLGVERIGHYEHVVVEGFKSCFGTFFPSIWKKEVAGAPADEKVVNAGGDIAVAGARVSSGAEDGEPYDHGVLEAEARNAGPEASLWTQLALAYAIHKSFIFIRVPLTAAVTPKVVKVLRRWGWNIGKRTPKSS
ncbi:hypothetical protein AJ78_03394 [Emergomyces pasteurianus Ep9510]|uniref:DUF1279 domain-containing protein n=1 Tax=Emergomyces pasteurianus Ep9510 TaxID=1447872 RepID=A0A1J9QMJ1_9EURO|nr:hypothetical protein AJ78_03394 [Emergomyces pasteurianus Ep9510]